MFWVGNMPTSDCTSLKAFGLLFNPHYVTCYRGIGSLAVIFTLTCSTNRKLGVKYYTIPQQETVTTHPVPKLHLVTKAHKANMGKC